jgi:hypothetical protein
MKGYEVGDPTKPMTKASNSSLITTSSRVVVENKGVEKQSPMGRE